MSCRVLVADDSTTIRRIIVSELQRLGITDITEAGDGVEAQTAAARQSFDVILLDWNMPKAAGLDTLRAIRSRGDKTPVIMLTAESEKACVLSSIQLGAQDYLVKPFTGAMLASKISRYRQPASV